METPHMDDLKVKESNIVEETKEKFVPQRVNRLIDQLNQLPSLESDEELDPGYWRQGGAWSKSGD